MKNIINVIAEAIDDSGSGIEDFALEFQRLNNRFPHFDLPKYDDSQGGDFSLLEKDVKRWGTSFNSFLSKYPSEEIASILSNVAEEGDIDLAEIERLTEYVSDTALPWLLDTLNKTQGDKFKLASEPFDAVREWFDEIEESTSIDDYYAGDSDVSQSDGPRVRGDEEEKEQTSAFATPSLQHGSQEVEPVKAPESQGDFEDDPFRDIIPFNRRSKEDTMSSDDYDAHQKVQDATGPGSTVGGEEPYSRDDALNVSQKGISGFSRPEYSQKRQQNWGLIQDGLRSYYDGVKSNEFALPKALKAVGMGHIGGFLSQIQRAKTKVKFQAKQARKNVPEKMVPVFQVDELIDDESLTGFGVEADEVRKIKQILEETGVWKQIKDLENYSRSVGVSINYSPAQPFRIPYSPQFDKQIEKYVSLLNDLNEMEVSARTTQKKKESQLGGADYQSAQPLATPQQIAQTSAQVDSMERILVDISQRIIGVYGNITKAIENNLISKWIGTANDHQNRNFGVNGPLYAIFSKFWPESYDEYENVGAKLQGRSDDVAKSHDQLYTVYYFMPQMDNGYANYEPVITDEVEGWGLPGSSDGASSAELRKEQLTFEEYKKVRESEDPKDLVVSASQMPTMVYVLDDGRPTFDDKGDPIGVVLPLEKKFTGGPADLKTLSATITTAKGKKRFFTAQKMVSKKFGTLNRPSPRDTKVETRDKEFDINNYDFASPDFDHDSYLVSMGYNPNELVNVNILAGDETTTVDAITRSELSQKGWLSNPEIDLVDVFPVGQVDEETGEKVKYDEPLVYGVYSTSEEAKLDSHNHPAVGHVVGMPYREYAKRATRHLKLLDVIAKGQMKRSLNSKELQVKNLKLPLKKTDEGSAEIYSAEEIANGDYLPIDSNGANVEKKAFKNFRGNPEEYSKQGIASALEIVTSLRNDISADSRVFGDNDFQPWIVYKEELDDKSKSRMPAEALKLKLPPASESFQEVFGSSRRQMGLALLDLKWDGPNLVIEEFPWAIQDFDWERNPEEVAADIGLKGPGGARVAEYLMPYMQDEKEKGGFTLKGIAKAFMAVNKDGASEEQKKKAVKKALRIYRAIAKQGWTIDRLKNVPFTKALYMARQMWDGYYHDTVMHTKKGPDVQWVIDPNSMVEVVSGAKAADSSKRNLKCSYSVKIGGMTQNCQSKLPANNAKLPRRVAEISTDEGKTDWKMVSPQEGDARDKIAAMDRSGEVNPEERDQLVNDAETAGGSKTGPRVVNAQNPVCDRCWAFHFRPLPEGIVAGIFDDLEEIYNLSERHLKESIGKPAAEKNRIKNALIHKFIVPYFRKYWKADGPIAKVYDYINTETSLSPKYKKLLSKPIRQFYSGISEDLMALIKSPLISTDAIDPKTGKHFFSIGIAKVMRSISNLIMWAHGTRMSKLDQDPTGRLDQDYSIVTMTSLTRKDVRDARELSAAMRKADPKWRTRWTGARPETLNDGYNRPMRRIEGDFCRVAIKGFINEEASFNGLLGYMIEKCDDGMCLVELDPNNLVKEAIIKVYPGELETIWDTKKRSDKEEYLEFLEEIKSREQTEQRIIDIIGDNTNEYLYR
tara:strand:+ start:28964 stop:33691 length:4728 start_codon:yes stop_codon:yes gene_type:complete